METMSDLQAVFWDMDGTLVDTEPYWIASERELVEAHGGTWSQEQAHLLVGQALEFSASVLQEAGVDMGNREIIDHLTAEVAARCAERIPWRPGARELLDALNAEGVHCALVTMSYAPLAEAIVSALPDSSLEFAVTGDMVTAGKPDPESYHLAFNTMAADHPQRTGEELDSARCIAIEDSVPGTASAVASGMVTVAVPHYAALAENGGWHLVDTLAGLDVDDLRALLHTPVPVTSTPVTA